MSEQRYPSTTVEVVVMMKPEIEKLSNTHSRQDQQRPLGEWAIVGTGKLFHITTEIGDEAACVAQAQEIVKALLCNPVIEEFEVSDKPVQ